jgi:hypothetical protein
MTFFMLMTCEVPEVITPPGKKAQAEIATI